MYFVELHSVALPTVCKKIKRFLDNFIRCSIQIFTLIEAMRPNGLPHCIREKREREREREIKH